MITKVYIYQLNDLPHPFDLSSDKNSTETVSCRIIIAQCTCYKMYILLSCYLPLLRLKASEDKMYLLFMRLEIRRFVYFLCIPFLIAHISCLSTCFLAGEYSRSLWRGLEKPVKDEVTERDILCVQIAALCHDLGKCLIFIR